MKPITRILSDLHFGHPASYLKRVEMLQPLLDGVSHLILNGDSVETRFAAKRAAGVEHLRLLRQLFAQQGAEFKATFLTGNHDPDIAPRHHLDLAAGRLFITHGDAFFSGLSPWSRDASLLLNACHEAIASLPPHPPLEKLLPALRRAILTLEGIGPKPHHLAETATLRGFLAEVWPPVRPLLMLRCWFKAVALADSFTSTHRPEAKVTLMGHTHRATVRTLQGRTIINTGSFLPYSGCLLADYCGETITVRTITRTRDAFSPGREVARLSVN